MPKGIYNHYKIRGSIRKGMGENAKKDSIRAWLYKHKEKPELCTFCNKRKPRDLFALYDEHSRNFEDWIWICRSCTKKRHPWHNQYGDEQPPTPESIQNQDGLKRYKRTLEYNEKYYKKHKRKISNWNKKYREKNERTFAVLRHIRRAFKEWKH